MTLLDKPYRQTRNRKLIRLIAIVMLIMTFLSSLGSLQTNAASFNINGSTLSATDVAADGKINMNISVDGGGITIKDYAFWYRKEGESKWKNLIKDSNQATSNGYVKNKNYVIYPNNYSDMMADTDSRYQIQLRARSTSNQTAFKNFWVTIGKPKISIDTFTAPDTTLGNKITLKTTLSDSTRKISGFKYQYKYTYINTAGTEINITDFQDNANYVWDTSNKKFKNIPADASCTLKVYVREKSNKADRATKAVTIKISKPTYPDVSLSEVTVSKSGETTYAGDTVTVKAALTGGTSPYQFKFTYDDSSGKNHVLQDYTESSNNGKNKELTYKWNTSNLSAGEYTVRVYIKDKNGKTANKTATLTLKSRTVDATVKTLEQSYTQNDGWISNVRFEVNITNKTTAPSPLKYKVQYKKSSAKNYTDVGSFETYTTTAIQTVPTSIDVGTYNYRVIIKDKNDKEYTINGSSTFEIKYNALKYSFNASPKEFVTGGDEKSSLTVTNVTGGTGGALEYKFEYTKYAEINDSKPALDENTATWTVIKDWSEESTSELSIEKKDDAGIYAVRVSVRNKGNTDTKKVVKKTIKDIKVKKPVEVTITDINDLITKIDTWCNNSLTDTQRNTIKNWETTYDSKDTTKKLTDIYDYHYSTFQAAYDTAKDASNHDKSEYSTIYKNLDDEFTKLKDFVKSNEFRNYSPNGDETDWSSPMGIVNFLFGTFTSYLNTVIDCFGLLSGNGGGAVSFFSGFDYNQIAKDIYPIFQMIGYSLIILLVGVNAIESALQYEMFTLSGGIKIAARLIFAKIFVDLSVTICKAIVAIGVDWTNDILKVTKGILNNLQITLTGPDASGLWIVGWIVDLFTGILFFIILGPVILLLALATLAVICKLFIRSFELAMLQCVAPAFFACLCGETTKEYFKRFIMSYISVVLDVVFTAIIFYIYAQYLNGFIKTGINITKPDEVLNMQSGFFTFLFVSIGAFILMIKTPRVLKNLVA